MRIAGSVMMLSLLFHWTCPSSWADSVGIALLQDSAVVVYGGSHYSHRSQNTDDLTRLYAEPLGRDVRRVLYRGSGVLSDIQAPPRGDLVGVLERSWEENVSQERATYIDRRVDENGRVIEVYYAEESILLILSSEGSILARIPSVRRYEWDPNGRRIVYITGSYDEGGFGFVTTGTWVYDTSSRRAWRIYPGGWDVHWANWDGNIYIYDPLSEEFPETRVWRFDLSTEQLIATSHQGIHFSPPGDHYFAQGYEGSPLRLFRAETDAELSVDLSVESRGQVRVLGFARGWVSDETMIITSPDPTDERDYLYDVGAATLSRATGPVVRGPGDRVLVLEGLSVLERNVRDFEVLR